MGIAIIIPGADFSHKNLGQVTITTESELTTIVVSGKTTVEGMNAFYTVSYNSGVPSSKKGVIWSIMEGGSYASINSDTGELTIKTNANTSKVVIKATSVYDNSISGTITISATYKEKGVLDLSNAVGFFTNTEGFDPFKGGGCVIFNGEISVLSNYGNNSHNQEFITGCAHINQERYYWPNITSQYEDKTNAGGGSKPCWKHSDNSTYGTKTYKYIFSRSNGIYVDDVLKTSEIGTMSGRFSGDAICLGRPSNLKIIDSDTSATVEAKIQALKEAGNSLPTSQHRTLKVKNFLVFLNTDYSNLEDALSNRQYADIDLQFDDDDVPYNAGINKNVKFITVSYD